MITGQLSITSDEWTEIASGSTWVQFSALGSRGVRVCFSENDTAPTADATCYWFQSWPNGFDFDQSGYPEGQRIWVRSIGATDVLNITRETNFYFLLIPDGSDSLITSDGDTFKVLGNG